jgi:hypothetical protein
MVGGGVNIDQLSGELDGVNRHESSIRYRSRCKLAHRTKTRRIIKVAPDLKFNPPVPR